MIYTKNNLFRDKRATSAFLAILLLILSLFFVSFSYADETGSEDSLSIFRTVLHNNASTDPVTEHADIFTNLEIKLSEDSNFIYLDETVPKYENQSIDAREILRTIPSITTEDKKTLGLLIPPFAYFAKKF